VRLQRDIDVVASLIDDVDECKRQSDEPMIHQIECQDVRNVLRVQDCDFGRSGVLQYLEQ